jgi:DNA-binding HxlR family transcriptional regulator
MSKDYKQFCGLAKAAAVLGERWALLILRDVMISPKRFSELKAGLPGVPTNVLTTRLRELENAGVVDRTLDIRPGRGVVYGLTEYGEDLRGILDAVGLWGARKMVLPEAGDQVTSSIVAASLQAAFNPGATSRSWSLSVASADDVSARAHVSPERVIVGEGADPDADLKIGAGSALRALLSGTLTADDALDQGLIEVDGPRELLREFTSAFRVPADV